MTAVSAHFIDRLSRTPASDVKRLGWRGVMQTLGREGRVLVTNHGRPEAVILSMDEYGALVQAAQAGTVSQETALDVLRDRFDARLSALARPDAGERLRSVLAEGAQLDGQVRAGDVH